MREEDLELGTAIKCTDNNNGGFFWWTVGKEYVVGKNEYGRLGVVADDGDFYTVSKLLNIVPSFAIVEDSSPKVDYREDFVVGAVFKCIDEDVPGMFSKGNTYEVMYSEREMEACLLSDHDTEWYYSELNTQSRAKGFSDYFELVSSPHSKASDKLKEGQDLNTLTITELEDYLRLNKLLEENKSCLTSAKMDVIEFEEAVEDTQKKIDSLFQ